MSKNKLTWVIVAVVDWSYIESEQRNSAEKNKNCYTAAPYASTVEDSVSWDVVILETPTTE